MAWTNQQEMAINARNCSVIVSAAAGSGKTAVLVERILNLLMDEKNPVRADRMIIATFTNDAASELRQRLNLRFLNEINNNPDNPFLLKQYTLLRNAKISTINAFCFDLLRDNISEQGITAEFSILDESMDSILKNEAIEETLNKWCNEKPEEIDFLFDTFCTHNDDNIVKLILDADKFLSSLAIPSIWLKETLNEFEKPFEKTKYYEILKKENETRLKKAIELAEENSRLINLIFNDDTEKECEIIRKSEEESANDIMKIEKAKSVLNSENNDEILKNADYCTSFDRLVTVKKNIEYNEELRGKYKANRDNFKALIKECFTQLKYLDEDLKIVGKIFKILKNILENYYNILWEKKCEKNSINFNDGEQLALNILCDIDENDCIKQSTLAKSLSEYYDIIMIDEYQDSNNKQDLIFKLISKNCNIDDKQNIMYGNNSFLVGDVKQSIYKFRLANPQNFIDTFNYSTEFDYNKYSSNAYIKLNKNFRSSNQVIDFVNFIFKNIMSEECGDLEYDESEMLYFGAEQYKEEINNNDLKTEIMLIDDENMETDDDNDETEIHENNEAFCIAQKIATMIKNKTEVISGVDKKRPCEARDFCILVRKNKYTKAYINELQKLGVYAKGEEEKGYLSSREIMILLDVLRIIDNPLQDLAMTAVMMSPMFMFTAEEMTIIRSIDKEKHIYLLLEEISDISIHENNPRITTSLQSKCIAFYGFIKSFRLLSVTLSTEELIKKIYDTTDFVTVMQLYTDGEKKQANLRYLINYAHNYESSSSEIGGVSGFIRYIDKIIASGKDFQQGKISSTSDNYVSIKTMHKSKGLEYPFVFIAETNAKFKFDYPQVLMSTDNRIGFVVNNSKLLRRYRTLPYSQILNENIMDTCSEEMRLLYVALTRAKQKLFVSLKVNSKVYDNIDSLSEKLIINNENIKTTSLNSKSMSDWLWLCLIKHKGFKSISSKIGYNLKYNFDKKLCNDVFSYNYYQNISSPNEEVDEKIPEFNYGIINEIRNIWNYNYNTELSETPVKLSVTQIAKKLDKTQELLVSTLPQPSFDLKTLQGTERGTAIHTFLQYCSFENAIEDPNSEIWRLCDNGYLSPNEADAIPVKKITAFFKSNLYLRMTKSNNVVREMKFMVALNELKFDNITNSKFKNADGMIKGIMDLIFEENDNLVLVDYKSDRCYNEDILIDKYLFQLNLYKQALEIITTKKVSQVYIYSIEMEKEILLNI